MLRIVTRQTNGTLLTKRIVNKAVSDGIRKAAARTMHIMGYTVVAENGWVVKKYANGRTVKISRITPANRKRALILD